MNEDREDFVTKVLESKYWSALGWGLIFGGMAGGFWGQIWGPWW